MNTPAPLRVILVDDEPLALRALARLLSEAPGAEVLAAAASLSEGLAAIAELRPDAVFLDVELEGAGHARDGDGFALLAALDPPPPVVFVSAHPAHAVRAFAVEATDYLLKPVTASRLEEALRRLRRRLDAGSGPAFPASPDAPLELRLPNRTLLAPPSRIAAITAEGDFARIHLAEEPSVLILRTLSHFEEILPAPPFARVGRSTLVNLARVRRLASRDRNLTRVTLEGLEAPLSLGRAATARLRAALAGRTD